MKPFVAMMLILSVPGCAGRPGVYAGATLASIGLVTAASSAVEGGDKDSTAAMGAMLLLGCLAMMAFGVSTEPSDPPPAPLPMAVVGPPPITVNTTVNVAATPTTPAEDAIMSREGSQLAIEASTAAHAGNCQAAVAAANHLAAIDPDLYYRVRERDTALAGCYKM